MSRQTKRSEETKRAILEAAGSLFAMKGYETVTMREIAREAGCSHTTIYLYFEDKETLLHHLVLPPLLQLTEEFKQLLANGSLEPLRTLIQLSEKFILFCMRQRNMADIFFGVKSERVDEPQPKLEMNRIRNELFSLIRQGIALNIPEADAEELLSYARIYYYMMQGMVTTYTYSEEPLAQLLTRVMPLVSQGAEIFITGIQTKRGGNE
ncbi:TetR/AcrR family transcriptional regulator [Paenibacillus sp. J2TS4]|uniref:TetR/AcrR family transcriptional regulator n=1 Tax=Paenibacillus sp. J2TS4 TaxID=2807194 RepID=UPI001AFE6305|nr:TetR/AcrR family transcriptional regulator [Paenibacillus sp. J2TS4]GIP36004.1 hypothetical protein J2TS4_52140 [Paenibacillus sp. J2TS4]